MTTPIPPDAVPQALPTIHIRVAGVSFENRDGSLRQTYVRAV